MTGMEPTLPTRPDALNRTYVGVLHESMP